MLKLAVVAVWKGACSASQLAEPISWIVCNQHWDPCSEEERKSEEVIVCQLVHSNIKLGPLPSMMLLCAHNTSKEDGLPDRPGKPFYRATKSSLT